MRTDECAIWDVLVLTAGNFKQKRAFELQLLPDYRKYYSECIIIEDQLPNAKIGEPFLESSKNITFFQNGGEDEGGNSAIISF